MKHRTSIRFFALLAMLGMYTQSVLAAPKDTALRFDGVNDYVTFGPASGLDGLGLQVFTIELWFKKLGPGTTTSTGNGGITAVPLVTKGMAEAENSSRDMNYFFGIDQTGVLTADFEECARSQAGCPQTPTNRTQGGQNFPVKGKTVLQNNTWYHAAVTFDGRYWKIYLNGVLEGMTGSDTGAARSPRWDSIQHAAFATALNSCGTAGATCSGSPPQRAGHFDGVIDEVHIWNVVRSQAEIRQTIRNDGASGPGLVARWDLNEGPGKSAIQGGPGVPPGTLTNGPVWVAGHVPSDRILDTVPVGAPAGLSAVGANHSIALDWQANTDLDLAGYNVYRGTVPNLYARINAAPLTDCSYIDVNLDNGTEYFYIVRAVDTAGNESSASNTAFSIPQLAAGSALAFTTHAGTYVTFGDPRKLDLPTFTVETWFKQTGAGTPIAPAEKDGISRAIPLVSHGARHPAGVQSDASWMLSIDDARHVIAGEFEQEATGRSYPITGVTPILKDTWHHAALTYDGATGKLYLDGRLEASLKVVIHPRPDGGQPAALGTQFSATGVPNGFFNGVLDETRVWNRALPQAEIVAHINHPLSTGNGLVARWGLDEGTGTTAGDSVATLANGAIAGKDYAWVPGAPFNVDLTPAVPALVAPQETANQVPVNASLRVRVGDPRGTGLAVSFYGRERGAARGEDFTLIAIPDPQFYSRPAASGIYNAQMNWITLNRGALNIQYVMSLGDNVDSWLSPGQWTVAASAWDILTNAGIPYGLAVGNHDGAPSNTLSFNNYFGTRLSDQGSYGGHYGGDYDNSYSLFSSGGMDFIVLFIEYDDSMTKVSHPVLAWADGILASYPSRRAIVITHNLLNGSTLTLQGQAIYDALKDRPNLFLMLGGHQDEAGRKSLVYQGRTVYALRSDYQFVDNWDSGYLRILRFSPADGRIHVSTYSPTRDLFRPDSGNAFDLAYDMDGAAPFTLIGSTTVPSGSEATITWSGLAGDQSYEWYAVADNGGAAAVSPTWVFKTRP